MRHYKYSVCSPTSIYNEKDQTMIAGQTTNVENTIQIQESKLYLTNKLSQSSYAVDLSKNSEHSER